MHTAPLTPKLWGTPPWCCLGRVANSTGANYSGGYDTGSSVASTFSPKMGLFTGLLTRMGLFKMKTGVIIIGLANCGKTSIVHNLSEEDEEVVPTVGFSIDKIQYENAKLTIMDMSGQTKYKRLWEDYYHDAQGIVFVVDSADHEHMVEAKEVLLSVLEHAHLKGQPLLIFCNKADLPVAAASHEVATLLGVPQILGRAVHIASCSALQRRGVKEGMHWLLQKIKARL